MTLGVDADQHRSVCVHSRLAWEVHSTRHIVNYITSKGGYVILDAHNYMRESLYASL
jgi:hypothetical protein